MTTPDDRPTIDLRDGQPAPRNGDTIQTTHPQTAQPQTIDLRETRKVESVDTVLVPPQSGPPVPPPRPVEVLRFGPGVPAVLSAAPVAVVEPTPPTQRLRRSRAINMALTLALAAVVVWLLWPAGSLHVRSVSVRATPGVVACDKSADVVATVRINGNSGQLKYRWTRGDGVGSGTLVQSLARGQHSANLHLTWAFHGSGTYDAQATVHLLAAGNPTATVNFRYVC